MSIYGLSKIDILNMNNQKNKINLKVFSFYKMG